MKQENFKDIDVKWVVAYVLVLAAGITFLIINNTHDGIWNDEVYSAAYASHSIPRLLELVKWDSHPPLYYIMLSMYISVFGKSLFSLRLFSALGIFALALLGVGPVRKIFGNKAGMIFAFLVFTTPVCLSYGQEIRMYSWAAFFVTGSMLFGYIALTGPLTKNWIIYGMFLTAAGLTHYYAMMAAVFINASIGIAILAQKNRQKILKYSIVSAAVTALCIPAFVHLVRYVAKSGGVQWIPRPTLNTVVSMLAYPFSGKNSISESFLPLAVFIVLSLAGVYGIYAGRKGKKQDAIVPAVSLLTYFGVIIFGIVYSLMIKPAIVARYTVLLIGLFLLATAYAFSKLRRTAAVTACLVVFLACLPQLAAIEKNRYNGPVSETVSYIKENIRPDDCFIHTDVCTMSVFSYYFSGYRQFVYDGYIKENRQEWPFAPDTEVTWGPDLDKFLYGKKNIWIVNTGGNINKTIPQKWVDSRKIKLTGQTRTFKVPNSWLEITLSRAEAVN